MKKKALNIKPKYREVETIGLGTCKGCCFDSENPMCKQPHGLNYCSSVLRGDEKNIIYKEIK